jgi:hypothetical protein
MRQTKAAIYSAFFNRRVVALWESAWSVTILEEFKDASLDESLEFSEEEIIQRVKRRGLRVVSRIHRWKPPQRYLLHPPHLRKLDDVQLDRLYESLIEEPI